MLSRRNNRTSQRNRGGELGRKTPLAAGRIKETGKESGVPYA